MYCRKCGAQIADDSKFCSVCGTPVECEDNTRRREEFAGKIVKCPVCGTEIPSLVAICPSCGHEIKSSQVSSSLKEFTDRLLQCDAALASTEKKTTGWKSWGIAGKIGWCFLNIYTFFIPLFFYWLSRKLGISKPAHFSQQEAAKEQLILSYPFPNDRENILEALLLIKSHISKLMSEEINRDNERWVSIWKSKATLLYDKAKVMFEGDEIANKAYADITIAEKIIKHKLFIRQVVFYVSLVAVITVVITAAMLTRGSSI